METSVETADTPVPAEATPERRDRARAGALEHLHARHGAAVRRLASVFTRRPADRDDLTQDIWLAVWRAWPSFRGDCAERTFIMRIAHNRAISHSCIARIMQVSLDEAQDLPASSPGPDRAVASEQEAERLLEGLRHIPVASRQVMSLSLEGLPQAEIAEIVGISESNVAVRLHRARTQLRAWMEE